MKIIRKGDIFLFSCESCGCRFAEGVHKTSVASAGVGGCNGVYHECPECGCQVLGYRLHPDGDLRKVSEKKEQSQE